MATVTNQSPQGAAKRWWAQRQHFPFRNRSTIQKVMPKSRGRPKRKIQGKPARNARPGFRVITPAGDHADMREKLSKAALEHVERLPSMFLSMQDLFRRHDPAGLIASIAFYALQRGMRADGSISGSAPGLGQHDVELLQAILLTIPFPEWGDQPTVPMAVQQVFDQLPSISTAFLAQRIVAAKEWNSTQERTIAALQERVRFHTHAVRNWGYFGNAVEIAREIYGGLDQAFLRHHGFAATDVVEIGRVMVAELERRANAWMAAMRPVALASHVPEMLSRYFDAFPEMRGTPETLANAFPADARPEQVLSLLMGHADLRHLDSCTFDPAELSTVAGLPEPRVTSVLRSLSLQPGALAGQKLEHLFLTNPVWRAPGIEIGGRVVIPMPQAIMSHIHAIMRRLAGEAEALSQLDAGRNAYLERRTVDTLAKALPGADVRAGVEWKLGDQRFETDAVAQIDKVLLIAEAKAHHLTPEGLRGAPDRVKRHVRDLVIDPSIQSARLEATLREAQSGSAVARAALADAGIHDPEGIERVIRLSVSLDDLSVLSSAEPELREAGWVPENHELAPMMNIADLMVVADILGQPVDFLHYLSERGPFQRAFELLGDELDFLGLYLETGFNLGAAPVEMRLSPSGMSALVDRYYDGRDAGLSVSKPRPLRGSTFGRIIETLHDRRPAGWTLIGMHLLGSADGAEQSRLERMLQKARKGVRRKAAGLRHGAVVQVVPPVPRKAPVAFYVHDHADRDALKASVESVASELMDQGAPECVVFARHIDRWDEPYQIACIAKQLPPHEGA